MISVEVVTVRRGSTGPAVKRLQALLAANFGQTVTVDGNYGPQTSTGVLNVQRFFGMTADDVVGPQTWGIILSQPPS
jgi:peptidoglycan hydrolase-like protein with peptidoglycan-binding domain